MATTLAAAGELGVTRQDAAGEHRSANRVPGLPTVHAELTGHHVVVRFLARARVEL